MSKVKISVDHSRSKGQQQQMYMDFTTLSTQTKKRFLSNLKDKEDVESLQRRQTTTIKRIEPILPQFDKKEIELLKKKTQPPSFSEVKQLELYEAYIKQNIICKPIIEGRTTTNKRQFKISFNKVPNMQQSNNYTPQVTDSPMCTLKHIINSLSG